MIKQGKLGWVALLLTAPSWADVTVTADGMISADSCAYGRGQLAIGAARDNAAADIANFLQGSNMLSLGDNAQQLDSYLGSLSKQQKQVLIAGVKSGAMPLQQSSPSYSGNDTCISVTLDPRAKATSAAPQWQEQDSDISVTVDGEGWPNQQMTARQQAEQDALQRAVSQVVGVWLTQQRTQSSVSQLALNGDDEQNALNELVTQQLHSRSRGLVKEWHTLATQVIEPNGIRVTIEAVVDKAPLQQQIQDILSAIGSPVVTVQAPEPLNAELKNLLTSHGVEVANHAALNIVAEPQLVSNGNNQRLNLHVKVLDSAGNVYGSWHNQPSLLSLPQSSHVLADLISVSLADPQQKQALQQMVTSAFNKLVANGGLVRKLTFSADLLQQPDNLGGVLGAIGGVSDVSIVRQGSNFLANLRFSGSTAELAALLAPALSMICGDQQPQIDIQNDYQVTIH